LLFATCSVHGDSYGAGRKKTGVPDSLRTGTDKGNSEITPENMRAQGYEKSLLLQAYRLVIRMIDEQGWILRNQIIWHKPNCMPSSVEDRFSVDYEPIFFFTKSQKYFFEPQYEPYAPSSDVGMGRRFVQGEATMRSSHSKTPYRMRGGTKEGRVRLLLEETTPMAWWLVDTTLWAVISGVSGPYRPSLLPMPILPFTHRSSARSLSKPDALNTSVPSVG
jgi:hypothetical protein